MVLDGVLLEMMKKISGQRIYMKAIPHGSFYLVVNIKMLIQMNTNN